jgi:hypothetical protein
MLWQVFLGSDTLLTFALFESQNHCQTGLYVRSGIKRMFEKSSEHHINSPSVAYRACGPSLPRLTSWQKCESSHTVKDQSGKTIRKQSQFWYIDYKTADGTRKRVKGFKDKTATTQLAAQVEP